MTSVIVPVYNAEQFLEDSIRSILNQTVRELELILVNDGSTDGSLEICRKAAEADSRVTVLSTPNRGVSAARNAAIDICKGETLTFVDADDVLHPQFLELLLPLCSEPFSIAVGASTVNTSVLQTVYSGNTSFKTLSGIQAAELSLYQKVILNSPWGKIYRRELFFNPDLRFRSGLRFEDLEIATPLLCRASKVNITPVKLYFYRNNPEGFMNSNADSRMDCLKVTALTEQWVKENKPELLPAAISRKVSASLHIFRWVNKLRPEFSHVADSCFNTIVSHRRELLKNPDVRIKNKAALAASFTGQKFLSFLCKLS